ncbi:MAG TPA: nucleotide sugar dehydrogenase [Verrucomicrobiaceae bacterium]
MNISIFGLGYVGAVTAGCLAELGHTIVGADVQRAKVDAFNSGASPIIEPELDGLLQQARRENRLRATSDAADAVAASEASIICVGTPSLDSGRLNLEFVRNVSGQIAQALMRKGARHTVIFRSTMLPGSMRGLVHEFFSDSQIARMTQIYYCPEFLREGTAVKDFRDPSLAVLGTQDGNTPANAGVTTLLGGKPATLTWEGAEMIKYTCNYFHALKVGFANEIGRLCKQIGQDGARVMDVVCSDERLNVSRHYLRPGNPFGGSCLPKDVSALRSFARSHDLSLPLLESALVTNQSHLDHLIQLISAKQKRRVGILGLAFKPDTDDLRNSPMVAVAETLLGRGYELHIYDPQLNLARLIGANASEINRRMPHLASLLRSSPGEVIAQSEVIVAAQRCARPDELMAAAQAGQFVIDVNGWSELKSAAWTYEGLCWE